MRIHEHDAAPYTTYTFKACDMTIKKSRSEGKHHYKMYYLFQTFMIR